MHREPLYASRTLSKREQSAGVPRHDAKSPKLSSLTASLAPSNPFPHHHLPTSPLPTQIHVLARTMLQLQPALHVELLQSYPVTVVQWLIGHGDDPCFVVGRIRRKVGRLSWRDGTCAPQSSATYQTPASMRQTHGPHQTSPPPNFPIPPIPSRHPPPHRHPDTSPQHSDPARTYLSRGTRPALTNHGSRPLGRGEFAPSLGRCRIERLVLLRGM